MTKGLQMEEKFVRDISSHQKVNVNTRTIRYITILITSIEYFI